MPDIHDRRIDRPAIRQGRPAARRVLAGAVLTLSLAVAATGAQAEAQAPAGEKPGAASGPAAPGGNSIEGHVAAVKKRLSTPAAQEPQFDQFATIVKQNAQTMDSLMKKA